MYSRLQELNETIESKKVDSPLHDVSSESAPKVLIRSFNDLEELRLQDFGATLCQVLGSIGRCFGRTLQAMSWRESDRSQFFENLRTKSDNGQFCVGQPVELLACNGQGELSSAPPGCVFLLLLPFVVVLTI